MARDTRSSRMIGRAVAFTDRDYLYGVGPVIVIVTEIGESLLLSDDQRWLSVHARVAIGTPANHGGFQERVIYLREVAMLAIAP